MLFNLAARSLVSHQIVNEQVIQAANNNNLEDDKDDHGRRWMTLWIRSLVFSRVDAVCAIGVLKGQLFNERIIGNSTRKTGLSLGDLGFGTPGSHLSDDAVGIICNFLRETKDLFALRLGCLPQQQYHRILAALSTNTSVKELYLHGGFRDEDDVAGEPLVEVLQNKFDIQVLAFDRVPGFTMSHILPLLRRGLPHLRKIGLVFCESTDTVIEQLIQALLDGKHSHVLEELDLEGNDLTSHGLGHLCALRPTSFPHLQKLNVMYNPELLEHSMTYQRFIQELLLAPDASLEELKTFYTTLFVRDEVNRQVHLMKALEINRSLRSVLFSSTSAGSSTNELFRKQLIASLPRMRIRDALVDAALLAEDDDVQELRMAFRENTSLLNLATYYDGDPDVCEPVTAPFYLGILKRNKDLLRLDGLLGTTKTTTSPTTTESQNATATATIPCGLWPRILAQVGQGSGEGASPVFKVLQDRLGSWSSTNNASKQAQARGCGQTTGSASTRIEHLQET